MLGYTSDLLNLRNLNNISTPPPQNLKHTTKAFIGQWNFGLVFLQLRAHHYTTTAFWAHYVWRKLRFFKLLMLVDDTKQYTPLPITALSFIIQIFQIAYCKLNEVPASLYDIAMKIKLMFLFLRQHLVHTLVSSTNAVSY